ncbi:hypothetical protein [Nocardia alni]|uniref:hypothetical protein n=1 Tax=Nocardia alni TaxID=2815723 RepID=UPI001C251332|nr:hypothetical protein [Nocardia alni]
MGRPTGATKRHYTPLPDRGIGCWECGQPATWWADWKHNGYKRFVSTAYCDRHGHNELRSPSTTARKIR